MGDGRLEQVMDEFPRIEYWIQYGMREELLDRLRWKGWKEGGEIPSVPITKDVWSDERMPGVNAYEEMFGSFTEAKREAGFPVKKQNPFITRDQIYSDYHWCLENGYGEVEAREEVASAYNVTENIVGIVADNLDDLKDRIIDDFEGYEGKDEDTAAEIARTYNTTEDFVSRVLRGTAVP